MSSVSVVTSSQLEFIRSKIRAPETSDRSKQQLELHETSKRRAAGWPNTLEANRERKERIRLERLAADETERQKRDKQEAETQATQRREVIEKVNKMLFNETDKAKGFHSSVLICDVVAERSAQIEFKHQIQGLKMAQEQAFVRQQREQLALAEKAEVQKVQETKKKALLQRDAQFEQLDDLKTKILAEREQNRLEGEMLRAKAAEEARDMIEKERQGRERAQQANWETAKANDVLRAFKLKEEERDRAADVAIEVYAAKKVGLLQERKQREAAREDAKEKRRQAMVALMESKFAEFMSNEGERLDRDVAEAEEKNTAELAQRDQDRRDEWDAICRSRTQQLNMREAKTLQGKLGEQEFVAAWKERTKELQQEEVKETASKHARAKNTQAFQKHQASLKQRKVEKERLLLLKEAAMEANMSSDAEIRFQNYAKEFISEYERQGKPVKPMLLNLSHPEPFVSA